MRFGHGLWGFSLGVTGNTLNDDTLRTVEKIKFLLESGEYDFILFTGGIFDQKSGQTIPVSHLMRDSLGTVSVPVYVADQSVITREDVKDGLRTLENEGFGIIQKLLFKKGMNLPYYKMTAVSEKWHLKGIKILLEKSLLKESLNFVPSGFKLDFKRVIGRIIRLILYRVDPEGNKTFSQKIIKKRVAI